MRITGETLPKQSTTTGFSLVELMIVLAIIAIGAAIAVPSYQNNVDSTRKTSAANNLLGALQFARSEAVIRRKDIKICASAGGTSCSGTNWSAGGVVLDGTTVIRSIPPAPSITINGNAITFKSDGTTVATNISVGTSPTRTISVNIVGHAKINY